MIGNEVGLFSRAALLVLPLACSGSGMASSGGADANLSAAQSPPEYTVVTLSELAGRGLVDALTERLAAGANPNDAGSFGWTPLQTAARAGQSRAIERLLAAGADPNLAPPGVGVPPLCLAAVGSAGGHTEAVRLLLAHGARPNEPCAGSYGQTPLMVAAERGNANTLRELLAAGADVNAVDWTPYMTVQHDKTALMYAAMQGHAEATRLLLDAGAAVNAKMLPYGWTALWLATDIRCTGDQNPEGARVATARELLRHGADVSAAPVSDPRTPLLVAAQGNCSKLVAILLEFGASPNDRDAEGQTALMHAAKHGNDAMVRALLDSGADTTLTDNLGRTAIDLANALGFSEVAQRLGETSGSPVVGHHAAVAVAPNGPPVAQRVRSAAWQFSVPDGVSRGPYLVGNVVIVGSQKNVLYGLDDGTGRQLWTRDDTRVITATPTAIAGLLVIAEGTGAKSDGRGTVQALEPRKGTAVWSRTFRVPVEHFVPTQTALFVQTMDGELNALAPQTGTLVWTTYLGPGSRYRPAAAGAVIAVVTGDGDARGIDAQTGRTVWQLRFSEIDLRASQFAKRVVDSLTTPKAHDAVWSMSADQLYHLGVMFCYGQAQGTEAAQTGSYQALTHFYGDEDGLTIARIAQAEICPPATPPAAVEALLKDAEAAKTRAKASTAPLIAENGQIFIRIAGSSSDHSVIGLLPESGAVTVSVALRGFGKKPPVVGGTSLFVWDRKDVIAFDWLRSTRKWALDLQGQIDGADEPTIIFHKRRLFLDGNTLVAVDADSGSIIWRGGPELHSARLLGTGDDVVYCWALQNYVGVDPATGAVLWTTGAGENRLLPWPSEVAYSTDMFFYRAAGTVIGVRTADRGHVAP